MVEGRRSFISCIVAILAAARSSLARQQQQSPFPRVPGVPGADRQNPFPGDEPPRAPDPKEQLKENQKTLRRDVDRLLELAQELKTESEKTEQTSVLSLSLIHKAEEAEKLARQIKSLARAV
jgi:hypothetical protein